MSARIKNLDPLRGYLALTVLIYHVPLVSKTVGLPNFSDLPIFHRGYHAVVVFFSLSGYLIIGLLYDEKKKFGFINIKNFYIRRILRLYPVYYFVLVFGFLYYHYLLPLFGIPFEINYKLTEGIALCVGFLPNVFAKLYDPGSILEVLWSIGVEEQFYLLIAPLLFITPLNKYFRYLLFFTIVYFVAFHTDIFFFLKKYNFMYFFMSMGGLLAVLNKMGHKLHFKSFILRVLVYLMFFAHFTTDIFQFQNTIFQNVFEVILFNLFIVNLANDEKLTIKSSFFNYLGQISYGIYMYHMIVVNFVLFVFMKVQERMYLNELTTILLINFFCILITIVASHLSFKYFEAYFLGLKKRFRK